MAAPDGRTPSCTALPPKGTAPRRVRMEACGSIPIHARLELQQTGLDRKTRTSLLDWAGPSHGRLDHDVEPRRVDVVIEPGTVPTFSTSRISRALAVAASERSRSSTEARANRFPRGTSDTRRSG